nr:twin-arginine translocation signal domain-containing protein [Acetobacter persici]
MIQSRRNFLGSSGLVVAAGALTACTIATNGKTTTLTLNTAKVKAYGQAGINAVTTILSVTSIATAMGVPAVAAIEAAGVTLSASLTAFASETNGSLTISYDNTSAKTRLIPCWWTSMPRPLRSGPGWPPHSRPSPMA